METLPEGWEQQLKDFPRLMLAIIGAGRKEEEEVTEFARYTYCDDYLLSPIPRDIDAIGFRVSTKAKLVGIGMYPDEDGDVSRVAIKIYQGEQLLLEDEVDCSLDPSNDYTKLHLKTAVDLEAHTLYEITAMRLSHIEVPIGGGGGPLVKAKNVWVNFSSSARECVLEDDGHCQIPAVYLIV